MSPKSMNVKKVKTMAQLLLMLGNTIEQMTEPEMLKKIADDLTLIANMASTMAYERRK